jgi:diguanylate cyclase (GGDEF)-like protein
MDLPVDTTAGGSGGPVDVRSSWVRRGVGSALLAAALVGVVLTVLAERAPGSAAVESPSHFNWLLPCALLALSGLTWALYEFDVRSMRRQAQRLRQELREGEARAADLRIDLERAREELARLSRIDELTGLANEKAFIEAVDEEWRRAARQNTALSLLVIDIDHFEAFRREQGPAQADGCLQAVGAVLKASARRAGDIAARREGSRFAVLFANTDRETATALARRVRAAVHGLALPHPGSRVAPHVTVSIGVAGATPSMRDCADTLLSDGADALHVARASGCNRVETMWRRPRSA